MPRHQRRNKTVTGGRAELTFRNTLDEVVQKEVVPMRVAHTSKLGGYEDYVDLSLSPLKPGQTQSIRLVSSTFRATGTAPSPICAS